MSFINKITLIVVLTALFCSGSQFLLANPNWGRSVNNVEITHDKNIKHQQESADELAEKLLGMHSLSANFSQNSIDSSGRHKMEQGAVQIKRPNQFRWNIRSPFSQDIIAKEGKLWIVDPDFMQVIIKNQDHQSGTIALNLLSGNARQFLKEYLVTSVNHDQEVIYTLKPRKQSDLFEMFEIHFFKDHITTINMIDYLGGKRRIDFTKVELNRYVDKQLFNPNIRKLEKAGFDIIDESGL